MILTLCLYCGRPYSLELLGSHVSLSPFPSSLFICSYQVHPKVRIEPDLEATAAYRPLLQQYKKLGPALRPISHGLHTLAQPSE